MEKDGQGAPELLYRIGREVANSSDRREMIQRVLQLSIKGTTSSSGSIIFLDEQGRVIEGAFGYAERVTFSSSSQFTDIMEQGLAGWVAEQRRVALIPNTRADARWLQRSWDDNGGNSRSAISAPLIANDWVMGVLTLTRPLPGEFVENDLILLTSIALCLSLNGSNEAVLK